jgi:FecR-like protein
MKKINSTTHAGRAIHRSIAFIAVAAMLGLLNASSTVRADDSVGSVTQVSGGAQIGRGGAMVPAQQGAPVKLHDTVTTQADGSVTLGFGDGSSLALAGSTSVAIEDGVTVNGQLVPSRVTLISGDIHTNVPGQQRSIEVNSPNAKVTGASPNH